MYVTMYQTMIMITFCHERSCAEHYIHSVLATLVLRLHSALQLKGVFAAVTLDPTHVLNLALSLTLFSWLGIHGYLEQKPLASAVSSVLQSNGIHSLLTSLAFSPRTPSKLR